MNSVNYLYNNKQLQKQAEVANADAIFTTFHSQVKQVTRHWERLVAQSQDYFGRKIELTLAELEWIQAQFSVRRQTLKVSIDVHGRCLVSVRAYQKQAEPLVLMSMRDSQRSDEARLKLTKRTYYLEQLDVARAKQFADVLYLDETGIVLETTITNVFWSDGVRLYTPTTELPILAGTYRGYVLDWCVAEGIEVVQGRWSLGEMQAQAVSIWLCNAVAGWQVVGQLDDWYMDMNEWTLALTQKIKEQEW